MDKILQNAKSWLVAGTLMSATLGSVGKPGLASSGPNSAWLHPAASTIEPTSPASPYLPGEKTARSRIAEGVFRQSRALAKHDSHNASHQHPWNGPPPPSLQMQIIPIELANPVIESSPVRAYEVVQTSDANGSPMGYSLLVKTDVCMDGQCKIAETTLHWDALGYYQRIEWDPGKPLTKKEHTPFTEADYRKIDSILRDRNSILRTQSLALLADQASVENEAEVLVDAITGATPATLQHAVVEGAAYTTWAMWRWANGDIVGELRRLTEKRCTAAYLNGLLHSDDRRHVDFALKYILQHHGADTRFLDSGFHLLEGNYSEHIALALKYVSHTMTDRQQLHARLIVSLFRMRSHRMPMVLEFLRKEPDLPPATLEGLTARIDDLPFYPVHLVLGMLGDRTFFSEQVEIDLCRLLDGEDLFVARRVSKFLLQQELSEEADRKLKAFRESSKSRP